VRNAKHEVGETDGNTIDFAVASEHKRCSSAFKQAAGNGQSGAT
jgi:hypothetical protein